MKPNRIRYEVLPLAKADHQEGVDPKHRWKVTKDGVRTYTSANKAESVAHAVAWARSGWTIKHELATLKIKGRKGRIQDERTYGNDPRNSKG